MLINARRKRKRYVLKLSQAYQINQSPANISILNDNNNNLVSYGHNGSKALFEFI